MNDIILYVLALTLFQIWLLPMAVNLKNSAYLLSNRDEEVETSVTYKRIKRAAANLQETLPIFLTLALLSMIMDIDNTQAATAWLALRLVHLACYSFGFAMLRSLSWVGSVVALVYMAMQLA
jgi:uncharacterized MAPEG superfamily protein|tara:strand:+ start:422 stop:787 length:366 start_codon:yes stop_codon:yes gene_type:complete